MTLGLADIGTILGIAGALCACGLFVVRLMLRATVAELRNELAALEIRLMSQTANGAGRRLAAR